MLLLWALLRIVFCSNGGSSKWCCLPCGSSMPFLKKKEKKRTVQNTSHPPLIHILVGLSLKEKLHTSNTSTFNTCRHTERANHGECISNKASLQRFSNILLQETETLLRQEPPSPRLSHVFAQVAVSVSVSEAVVQTGRGRQAARQETQIQSPFTIPLSLSFLLLLLLPITITKEPVFEI